MKKSKIKYEQYLNSYYACFAIDIVIEELFYLTDQERYRFCTMADIIEAWNKQTVGLLIRRYDSKLFDLKYEQWLKD